MIKIITSDLSRTVLFPKDMGYQGSLNKLNDHLLASDDYLPLEHFYLNEELLNCYKKYKNRVKVVLFTTGSVQNAKGISEELKDVFDEIYTISHVGFNKDVCEAYLALAATCNVKPEEILYIDDLAINIDAAKEAGLNVVHFNNSDQAVAEIERIMSLK